MLWRCSIQFVCDGLQLTIKWQCRAATAVISQNPYDKWQQNSFHRPISGVWVSEWVSVCDTWWRWVISICNQLISAIVIETGSSRLLWPFSHSRRLTLICHVVCDLWTNNCRNAWYSQSIHVWIPLKSIERQFGITFYANGYTICVQIGLYTFGRFMAVFFLLTSSSSSSFLFILQFLFRNEFYVRGMWSF